MLSKVILILFVSATIQGPVKSNYVLNNVEYPPEEYCPSFYDKWCSKWSHSLNNKTSLFTFRSTGRLANQMQSYVMAMAMADRAGFMSFLPLDVLNRLSYFFENIDTTSSVRPLESFCYSSIDWMSVHGSFERYMKDRNLQVDHAMEIYKTLRLLGNNLIQNMRWNVIFDEPNLLAKVKHTFTMRPYFVNKAQERLEAIKKSYHKQQKKSSKKRLRSDLQFVGVHVRRTDGPTGIVKAYNLPELNPSYYLRAIDAYMRKYKNILFVMVSDDMDWVKINIMKRLPKGPLFIGGRGIPDEDDEIGIDFAVLSQCNHSITSYGTFSYWSSFLTPGHSLHPSMVFTHFGKANPLDYPMPIWAMPDSGLDY